MCFEGVGKEEGCRRVCDPVECGERSECPGAGRSDEGRQQRPRQRGKRDSGHTRRRNSSREESRRGVGERRGWSVLEIGLRGWGKVDGYGCFPRKLLAAVQSWKRRMLGGENDGKPTFWPSGVSTE